MMCLKCQSTVNLPAKEVDYCKCPVCCNVFHICGENEDRHLSYFNVLYCPVCGKNNESFVDAESSKFLSTPMLKSPKKRWSDPQSLGFKKCSRVFNVLFDSFLIIVSNIGEYIVFDGNSIVHRHTLNLKEKDTISSLRYSLRRIVFLTKNRKLYQININTLFQKGSIEKISDNVSAFTFDSMEDRITYTKKREITIIGANNIVESIKEDGQVVCMELNNNHLFYVTKEQKLLSYVVRSLQTKEFSRKTITFTNNPDKILTTANENYLAVALSKGNEALIMAGKWKNLIRNTLNWDEITTDGSLISIKSGNDYLVFIQYSNRIEAKDMNNLMSGTLNSTRTVPDMIAQSLSLSLDGNYLLLFRRSIADTSFEASQPFLLSKNLREEYIGAEKANFIIDSFVWMNGLLVAIIKKNREYLLSLEEVIR